MLSGLLGSVLGFGGSVVPAITDHFKTKSNNKFELQKMEKMAELRAKGYDHEIKMYEQMGSDKEHDRLIQHDISINQGTGIIAGLQKSVRPVITYCFFGFFLFYKIVLVMEAMRSGQDMAAISDVIWDPQSQSIFAAIISFWFGSRAVEKLK